MTYNKARAEKEWLAWKNAEEKKLRELGVDEETIQRLHVYDWTQFNKERQYLQRWDEWSPQADWASAQDLKLPVKDTESLLDDIDDSKLLEILLKEDKLTLNSVLLKSLGYSTEQICHQLGISIYSYYNRVKRLKKKLKKFFESD